MGCVPIKWLFIIVKLSVLIAMMIMWCQDVSAKYALLKDYNMFCVLVMFIHKCDVSEHVNKFRYYETTLFCG